MSNKSNGIHNGQSTQLTYSLSNVFSRLQSAKTVEYLWGKKGGKGLSGTHKSDTIKTGMSDKTDHTQHELASPLTTNGYEEDGLDNDELWINKKDAKKTKPALPPIDVYRKGQLIRKRSPFERLNLLLNYPERYRYAMFWFLFMLFVIFLSSVCFICETLPSTRIYKKGCEHCKPVYRENDDENDTQWNARIVAGQTCGDCEPGAHPVFLSTEMVTVIIFTIDYLLKLFTSWSALSSSEERMEKERRMSRKVGLTSDENLMGDNPHVTIEKGVRRTLECFFEPLNMVDLLAILPFYISLVSQGGSSTTFLRLLRLMRVVRLLRFQRFTGMIQSFTEGIIIFFEAFLNARMALAVLLVYTSFAMVLLASVVYIFEQGSWDPETGRYMTKPVYYLDEDVPSHFTSIPDTFWWVLVTFTSTGYGDMYPTTRPGRFFGVFVMYSGLLFLPLPITIIGGKFSELYRKREQLIKNEQELRLHNANIMFSAFTQSNYFLLDLYFRRWKDFVVESQSQERNVRFVVQAEMRPILQMLKELQVQINGIKQAVDAKGSHDETSFS